MFWSNKRVLVTGGSGFIGSHLVRALKASGADVRSWDIEDGDLTDSKMANKACVGMHAVFHLAAEVGNINRYEVFPFHVASQNMVIDANVIGAAINNSVERVFYASSSHVDTDLSYGWAKASGEKLLKWGAKQCGLRYTIARICGAYGPGYPLNKYFDSLIPALCRRAAEYPESKYYLWTNGRETRSYVYISDVIDAIFQCMEIPGNSTNTVAGEHSYSVLQIANWIAAISGKGMAVQCRKEVSSIQHQAPPSTLNGWRPKVNLRDGLRITYEDVAARVATLITCHPHEPDGMRRMWEACREGPPLPAQEIQRGQG